MFGSAMQRVVVFGTSGSGKSTLAKALASTLSLSYFEMDALHWNPSWQATPTALFREKILAATASNRRITDENYTAVRDVVLARADLVLWLDYPFLLVFWRLLGRSLERIVDGKLVCNGNVETFANTFFSKNSVLLWVFRSRWRRKRQLPAVLAQYPHLRVMRFRLAIPKKSAIG
jgi:adenylate kinase family enzyme